MTTEKKKMPRKNDINLIRKKITVQQKEKNRLDVFVVEQFPGIPRTIIQKNIRSGNILVNKEKKAPSYQVSTPDQIEVDFSLENSEKKILPQKDLPVSIVFEHKDFVIINKPAGISVHPSKHEQSGTVVNWVLAHFPQIAQVGEDLLRPGIVHRLDKDTSGLLIVAKKQKSFKFFKELFKRRVIKKQYHAVCHGELKKEEGEIVTYMGKSKANPTKQATSALVQKLINPKDALTFFKVLKTKNEMSLVEVELKTGRKHQIRIHFQSIGFPLVGDKLYSTKATKQKNAQFARLFLHASFLSFEYLDEKKHQFFCPAPKEFFLLFK